MASTATASCRAGVTEEPKAEWWLLCNSGVPAGDGDVADSGDEVEGEGEGEGEGDDGAGGKAEMAPSGGRAARALAGDEEAEVMGSGDGRAPAVASGVREEMVGRGSGKAEAEAEAGAGGMRRSSSRFADRAGLDEEISGGNYVLPGELPRRKKAIAKRRKPNVGGVELQNDMSQAQSPFGVLKGPEQVYDENENLRLQLALKTNELKQEENRRMKLELILKAKEIESLRKQNEELKTENEQLRKNAKPERVKRLCRFCNTRDFHDYLNCPEREKLLDPLKKRTLTNTARSQPVRHIPFASRHRSVDNLEVSFVPYSEVGAFKGLGSVR